MLALTDDNWDDLVQGSDGPALVEFWAPWCGPCRSLEPTLSALAGHFKGKVSFGRVNTDESPELCARFEVSAIPTLLFFQSGSPVDRFVGVRPETDISTRLYRLLDG